MTRPVRHLYVHLPFCAYRCGYCDFVTVLGRQEGHAAYVDSLLVELSREGALLDEPLATIFLGGGTPTYTDPAQLERLLRALPAAGEVTVEANPETITPDLAALLRRSGLTRVSLGAQSFQAELLDVLDRRAGPDAVRRAYYSLRDASFDNISIDLLYGIPGQSAADLDLDIGEALRLGPEHVSYYELEAKPGTRFTHAYGQELERQAHAMEDYLERVVAGLVADGYRWYETANFCRPGREARHNLAYWEGRDYLGLGIGAVSTVAGRRWRNKPSLRAYVTSLAGRGDEPPREYEDLDASTQLRERLMLGLRLDRPVPFSLVEPALEREALARMEKLGLAELRGDGIVLTRRGRFLGGAVTAELMAS